MRQEQETSPRVAEVLSVAEERKESKSWLFKSRRSKIQLGTTRQEFLERKKVKVETSPTYVKQAPNILVLLGTLQLVDPTQDGSSTKRFLESLLEIDSNALFFWDVF